MAAVLSPLDIIETASGVSPYTSLHLPTSVLAKATPQDVAVLSVQATQLGETGTLFGQNQSNDPFAAEHAIESAAESAYQLPAGTTSTASGAASEQGAASSAAGAMGSTAPVSESPQQMLAGQQFQTVQALYGGQGQAQSSFSMFA